MQSSRTVEAEVARKGKNNPWAKADRFTKKAKNEGYAARSVYKLTEINTRFRILNKGQRVVDLGCSPGSWSRFVLEVIGPNGSLVGVDINPPEFRATQFLLKSVFDVTPDEILEALGGQADVVISDMAPLTTGNVLGDHVLQLELAQCAVDMALKVLQPGGHFVAKVFEGEDAQAFVQGVRPYFEKTKRVRPEAVRRQSREFFLVCTGFKPPAIEA